MRLLKGCPNLKKLFLAAIRGLTDRDLENVANLCPNLEQLDLLGVMSISTEKCYLYEHNLNLLSITISALCFTLIDKIFSSFSILTQCKKLKLIDLSFCVHLDDMEVIFEFSFYSNMTQFKSFHFLL